MIVIGLTGGSGSGKSTVAQIFKSHNIFCINADEIYHDLTARRSRCLCELADEFGEGIISVNGALNREALREIVFSNAEKLQRLTTIAHYHVLNEIRNILLTAEKDGYSVAVVDAPQLFESGFNNECDIVVAVTTDVDVRLSRIMQRDALTRDEALRRIKNQFSDEFFRSHADYLIVNNGSYSSLLETVSKIISDIKKKKIKSEG